MNIRYFRAADSLINPPDDITQNTLNIIFKFFVNLIDRQILSVQERQGHQFGECRARSAGQFLLLAWNIHVVIVHRVQGCSRWRGYPGTIRSRRGMVNFSRHHLRHFIRHGPHAFPNLSAAQKASRQTRINIPIFVGKNPGLLLHQGFSDDGPGFHTGMNFVPSTI